MNAWNQTALDAIRVGATPPPQASRNLAMVHLAIHDAMATAIGRSPLYVRIAKAPPGTAPPVAARALAILHVALYDAVNAVDRRYAPYAVNLRPERGASSEAAASQAAFRVVTALFPDQASRFDAALRETLAPIRNGRAKAAGRRLGERVGQAILALRASDGSSAAVAYTPGSEAGDWMAATPPRFAKALLPQWPGVKPFGIASGSQFRPTPPPTLDST